MDAECTNSTCEATATAVMAWGMPGRCVFVAPYCDDHAAEVIRHEGAVFAAGPALSDQVSAIAGIRRLKEPTDA